MEIYLQKNPKFAAEVDAAIKIWDQTGKLRSKTKTTEEEQHFAGTCLQAGSVSNFSLFNFTILDSGTHVHIVNDSMKHRIFSRRRATPDDIVNAGNVTLQPIEVVKATVNLRLGKERNALTLLDALYIPDFMANLVSLLRLTKIGLHYDTSQFAFLYKLNGNKKNK